MKVLFVCRQNVGRSQMAKAFYNQLTHSHDAGAAGTHVVEAGQTLLERKTTSLSKNFFVLDVMKDVGIDMAQYKRTPLARDDLERYDLVVDMANREDAPQWLLESPKYVYWDVKDSRGQDYETTAKVRDDIRRRVELLLKQAPQD